MAGRNLTDARAGQGWRRPRTAGSSDTEGWCGSLHVHGGGNARGREREVEGRVHDIEQPGVGGVEVELHQPGSGSSAGAAAAVAMER
jgi:hypothetical protein